MIFILFSVTILVVLFVAYKLKKIHEAWLKERGILDETANNICVFALALVLALYVVLYAIVSLSP